MASNSIRWTLRNNYDSLVFSQWWEFIILLLFCRRHLNKKKCGSNDFTLCAVSKSNCTSYNWVCIIKWIHVWASNTAVWYTLKVRWPKPFVMSKGCPTRVIFRHFHELRIDFDGDMAKMWHHLCYTLVIKSTITQKNCPIRQPAPTSASNDDQTQC